MTDTKWLLAVRKALKDRKPTFIRQEFGKFKKIKAKWTRPKGHHAKMRERRKGNPRMVAAGWRSPVMVRGLHSSGLARVVVASKGDLAKIRKDREGIILSAALGAKKRLALIAEAQKAGITILNLRDADAYVKGVQDRLAARKAEKTVAAKEKEQRKAALEKKAVEKARKEEKKGIEALTDEEKKKAEKEEKDKVLTKKE